MTTIATFLLRELPPPASTADRVNLATTNDCTLDRFLKAIERRALRMAERTGYRAPETKPDKRARRLIRALGDIDAL